MCAIGYTTGWLISATAGGWFSYLLPFTNSKQPASKANAPTQPFLLAWGKRIVYIGSWYNHTKTFVFSSSWMTKVLYATMNDTSGRA